MQSQQQLFNDFVLLREKYDEAKGRMAEILWGYLPAQTSFCPSIPAGHLTLLESDKRCGSVDRSLPRHLPCPSRPFTTGEGCDVAAAGWATTRSAISWARASSPWCTSARGGGPRPAWQVGREGG